MKTAILNVKVNEQVKKRAQAVAGSFGIPLSTLVNAYLVELGTTGQIYFAASEQMTEKMEKIAKKAREEVAAGDTSGPFETHEDLTDYLDTL